MTLTGARRTRHAPPDGRPALWACVITTLGLTASLWMGMIWLAQRFGH
jgi:hypothetical protein